MQALIVNFLAFQAAGRRYAPVDDLIGENTLFHQAKGFPNADNSFHQVPLPGRQLKKLKVAANDLSRRFSQPIRLFSAVIIGKS